MPYAISLLFYTVNDYCDLKFILLGSFSSCQFVLLMFLHTHAFHIKIRNFLIKCVAHAGSSRWHETFREYLSCETKLSRETCFKN